MKNPRLGVSWLAKIISKIPWNRENGTKEVQAWAITRKEKASNRIVRKTVFTSTLCKFVSNLQLRLIKREKERRDVNSL